MAPGLVSAKSEDTGADTGSESIFDVDKNEKGIQNAVPLWGPEYNKWLAQVNEEVMAMSDEFYSEDDSRRENDGVDRSFKRIPGVDYESRKIGPPPEVSLLEFA